MKTKSKSKPAKKALSRASATAKSIHLNAQSAKASSRIGSKPAAKTSTRRATKPTKVEARRTSAAPAFTSSRAASPERAASRHFASAIQAYEAGIKLMHAEEFEKAIRCFDELISEHPEEPEIQERAKVLIHACEKKIQDKGRTVLKSSDDHYNVGIADLNRRELGSAIEHLQQALRQTPKADHVLYALATANALKGNRDQALQYLKECMQYRPQNRFLATRDADFASLQEDPEFKHLVTSAEK